MCNCALISFRSYLHSVPTSYVDMLEENEVEIHSAPLSAFDTGMDEEEDGDDDCEVIEEEVFDASQPPIRKRSLYTEAKGKILIKAWENVSLDAIVGNDQTGRRYWQRVEDKHHHVMPKGSSSTRTL